MVKKVNIKLSMENLNEIFEVLNERVCIYMKQKIDEKLKDFPPLMRY